MTKEPPELPVSHPKDLAERAPEELWLIRHLWGRSAVGILGGAPKTCKSWLGLEMALSVASGTKVLGHFEIDDPGPALVYLAEDALPLVRRRIEGLCRHKRIALAEPALFVITAPSLRLDLDSDQKRLWSTVHRMRPKLLLLDPLVRLHRLEENSSTEISRLLGYLRELQRACDVAIVLVHHASKRTRSDPGQALRGSSDLHAFGDSNGYLARCGEHLVLTVEHRSAKALPPFAIKLVSNSDETDTHLEIVDAAVINGTPPPSLHQCVIEALTNASTPTTRGALRDLLRVNNQRLGEVLTDLERRDRIRRAPGGWVAKGARPRPDTSEQSPGETEPGPAGMQPGKG
jgi:hypothetical protein